MKHIFTEHQVCLAIGMFLIASLFVVTMIAISLRKALKRALNAI